MDSKQRKRIIRKTLMYIISKNLIVMKEIIFVFTALIFVVGCTNNTKDPMLLEKESVASGLVNDTLPLNYMIGMSPDRVYNHSKHLVSKNTVMLNKDSSVFYLLQTDNHKITIHLGFYYLNNQLYRTISTVKERNSVKIDSTKSGSITEALMSQFVNKYGDKKYNGGTKKSTNYWLVGNKRIDFFDVKGNIHFVHSDIREEHNFLDELVAQEEREATLEQEKAARKQKVDSQFSGWDGSHIKLTQALKASMNDPKSYEHVETVYWDMGDHLIVQTKYRGNNAFGGKVFGMIKAKVSMVGEIIEVIDQQ